MSVFEGLTIEYNHYGKMEEGIILQSQIIFCPRANAAKLVFVVLGKREWVDIVYAAGNIRFKKEDLERLRKKSPKYEAVIDRFELMEMEE